MNAIQVATLRSTAIAVLVAWPGIVLADDTELLRKIDELTARIRQLEVNQQQAQPPAQAPAPPTSRAGTPALRDSSTPAPATSATISAAPIAPTQTGPSNDYVTKGSFPGSILLPGTRTSLRIGGLADLDAFKDTTSGGGSIFIPQLIPFKGSAASTRRGQFDMTARQSRLYVRTQTPTDVGDIATYIDGDFYGDGGNENASNSVAFRLRDAYVEWGGWLAGQASMNITDLPTLVETLEFSGGMGTIGVGRQPQIRYTARWGGHNELMTALENPASDIYGTAPPTIGAATGPIPTQTLAEAPDLSMRYAYTNDWGRVVFGGVLRRLVFNNNGGAPVNGFVGESATYASLISAAGKINTFGQDSFQYSAATGAGAGRYILDSVANVAAAINDNHLVTIRESGFTFGYRHVWTPTLRSNLIYSRINENYPRPAVPLTVANRFDAIWMNLLWNPVPNALIGLEWNPARARNAAATNNSGRNNRWQSSFKYAF